MRKETAKFVNSPAGTYVALLGLSYIEKFNNESIARASGEERFDFDFYTTENGAQYWQNHHNFISLSGKLINSLTTKDRAVLCGLIQKRQDSIVINDGTEEGYSVSRNLLNVMNPYASNEVTVFNPFESKMVSIACLIGLGLEASKKVDDAYYNQEYVGMPIETNVACANAIINDENGGLIESFAKTIVEDDKKLFPEPNLGGVTMVLSEARMMDVTQ